MIFGEIRRLYSIIRIFLTYGVDELILVTRLTLPFRVGRKLFFWIPNRYPERMLGERLRLALEELGPVWIKLGQMLSTRRDLLSPEIADQLAILQDQVKPFDGALARGYIELSMGKPLETWLDDFEQKPLASASIAQVHAARLKQNGKEVVIKVIRPEITSMIKSDMRLMYWLARWVPRLLPDGKRLRPKEVVMEYEKSLLDELNLLREAANVIQFRRNFNRSSILYIPEVYPNYCRENMMVMERIYGVPVSDVAALKKQGTNMKLLAERGVQIFFTQVFRDSFFHGDMHPGNIFVSYEHPENPQYISIDCGIVGFLNKEDKRYLAENFIAFFNHDYHKVAKLHLASGWVPPNTSLKDFEFAIRIVCEPIFEKPLSDIAFSHVLFNLFSTGCRFNMEVQPQLVLLQKTMLYIEGLGRQLYPQLDLWKTAKPFLEGWLKDQVGMPAIFRAFKNKAPYWIERLPELPEIVYDGCKKYQMLQKRLDRLTLNVADQRVRQGQALFLFGVGSALLLSSIFLFIQKKNLEPLGACFMISGIVSWIIGWRRIA